MDNPAPENRLSESPISSHYGRPIKRAKRPYKNRGKPRALNNASQSRIKAEQNQAERAKNPALSIPSHKRNRLASNKGIEKARVLQVLLAGASAQQVSRELKLEVTYCNKLLKQLEQDTQALGIKEFASLLWRKVQGILHDHTTIGGSLELLLYQVDSDLQALSGDIDALLARISQHKSQEPPPGEAYNTHRTAWREQGKALEAEYRAIIETRKSLRVEKTALQKEKRANNKDLIDTISKMGVTTKPPDGDDRSPTAIPASHILPESLGYSSLGEGEALALLERGVSEMSRYLRERKKREQVVEVEDVKVP